MNNSIEEAQHLINNTLEQSPKIGLNQLNIFAVPFPYLMMAKTLIAQNDGFAVAAQNCSSYEKGAYTGEVAASMISNAGIQYVIIGHSERRSYFHETEALLADKVNQSLTAGLRVIFCCGEPLAIREAGTQNEFVADQIKASLFHLEADAFKHIVIAYEPIWAIGTGLTASSQQAQDMHAHIRSSINAQYGANIANELSILYGGSCKASNAAELFACEDVDGGLIGGASLVANDFVGIINAMP
jgi:triosephosphate isomerase